jgi:hypothetical protein
VVGQEALGMVLHAFQRKLLMSDPHDFADIRLCHDFKLWRQCSWANHEAVIAGGFERIRHASIDAFAVVMDHRGLAVHDPIGPNNLRAESVADALVAQTDA